MRKIAKPTLISKDVYLTCISRVKDADLKARLTAAQDLITEASTQFEHNVTKGSMNGIIREDIVNGNLTKKEMELVYTYRMAQKRLQGDQFMTVYYCLLNSEYALFAHKDR